MAIKFDGLVDTLTQAKALASQAAARLVVAEAQVIGLGLEAGTVEDNYQSTLEEIERLRARVKELEAQLSPPPLTVGAWLEERGFAVDGDRTRLEMSPDGKSVRVRPGALRCEIGPKDSKLAMIGRLPQSERLHQHVIRSQPAAGWPRHSSKVVGWQAWHTSNQNPSLSLEFVGDVQRMVHSFKGVRKTLGEGPMRPEKRWEVYVYGWLPGLRTVSVYLDGVRTFMGFLELLPVGSTVGPVVKAGAYFPSWEDEARLSEGNVVVLGADWKVVE